MVWTITESFGKAVFNSFFKFEKVKTDNWIFRMHYKLSVWLVMFYAACYMYVLIKYPITCMGSKSGGASAGIAGMYRKEINDFCWAHGTYVVTNLHPSEEFFPGIGTVRGREPSIRYQQDYKWMYIYMLAMILLLIFPRQFWRNIENGRMKSLVKNLKCPLCTNIDGDGIRSDKDTLAEYLYSFAGYHTKYSYGFVFAEFLNVMVSLFLVLMWDSISENEFSTHGTSSLAALQTPPRFRTDRLAKVFPALGKCTFLTFGSGQDVQTHDFICALPMNRVHERFAVFFWYYFIVLLILGTCALIFRFAAIGSKKLRVHLLCGLTPLTPPEDVEAVVEEFSYSDWFVIYQLGSAVEPVMIREIIKKLVGKLGKVRYEEVENDEVLLVLGSV